MKKLFLLLAFFATIAVSNSQVLQPVKWSGTVNNNDGKTAELIFKATIEKNWHLYSQNIKEGGPIPTTFKINKTKDFELVGKVEELSKGEEAFDSNFEMKLKYFSKTALFKQKIKLNTEKAFNITAVVEFMACDDSRCIPPAENDINFKIEQTSEKSLTSNQSDSSRTDSVKTDSAHNATTNINPGLDSNKAIVNATNNSPISKDDSLLTFFFLSFLAGLAAILTPCVFPMIPMTVSFFMSDGESKKSSKAKAFVYGFSIIGIYTIIGTIVAITLGANFANWLSTHWIPNVFFFLIFIVFAASFFGMFEITLPSWLITKSDKQVDKGGYMSAFFMAFTLVLVSFSCTGPIVGAILVASAGGEVLMPIIGMFGFALAFALPFTLFAIFPSWLSNLPKSGGWLNSVKVVLGFLELALGLKFLSVADQTYHWGILDREVYLALWIVIFTLLGLYLLGKIKFSHDSEVKHLSVPRLALVLVTFSFVVYLIPGMFGAPLKALSGYLPPMSSHDFDLPAIIRDNSGGQATSGNYEICDKPKYGEFLHLPHGIKGYFDYQQGMDCAKKQNKPVFIDFTGHGCVNCREMEANVWADPQVLKKLKENFVVIALYVDDKTELPESEWITSTYDGKVKKTIGKKYADFQISKFNVNAQPYYVLLDHNGNLLNQPRAYDKDIDAFVKFLDAGLSEFEKRK